MRCGEQWQAQYSELLLQQLIAEGHTIGIFGSEPQETGECERLVNLTGQLSKHEIMREVAECDLAICIDEQCYPALAADVPLVGIFLERTHLDLVPVDYPACVALYPALDGGVETITASAVVDAAQKLLSGAISGVQALRPAGGPWKAHKRMWSIIVFLHDTTAEQTESTRRCIEAIRSNTTVSHEIVVVDRTSRPETVRMICSQPDLQGVFLREGGGTAEAVASGIQNAHGDVIVLLHNDQFVEPGWEADFIDALETGAVMAGAHAWRVGPEGVVATHTLDEHGFLGFGGLAVPRSIVSAFGGAGPSAEYFELADLCWRATATGSRIAHVPAAGIRHFGNLTRPRISAAADTLGDASAENHSADVPLGLRHAADLIARWPHHLPETLPDLRERCMTEHHERALRRAHTAYFPELEWSVAREGP